PLSWDSTAAPVAPNGNSIAQKRRQERKNFLLLPVDFTEQYKQIVVVSSWPPNCRGIAQE
ncbi:MAG TPA: hypothetical protein VHE33_05920, partial [Acidobacteriaceae bacterium]|nr:hypothetical protein [Acidobacteriaceae bacterium]